MIYSRAEPLVLANSVTRRNVRDADAILISVAAGDDICFRGWRSSHSTGVSD